MTTTLPLFWHLSSSAKNDRLDASVKLVGALEQFQSQYVPTKNTASDSDDESPAQKPDTLDILNSQDVAYSIRRLIRGLASPRESSRLGFAVALTELLSRIDTVTCDQILSIIASSSKPEGSMTGQEERDMLFARLFGLMSVIRSGLLVRTAPLPTSASSKTEASTISNCKEVIEQLVSLGEKKSWLRESAWFTIGLAIDALATAEVSWKKEALDFVIEQLFTVTTTWGPEKIAISLKLQELFPERDWQKILAPTFKTPNLLSTSNLQTVSRIMKESTIDEEGHKDPTKAPSGTWKPQLHFAWDVILDQLTPGPNSFKKQASGSLQDFFKVVVDESLFSANSSPQRKYWGFQVVQKALKRVSDEDMPMIFTKNFMRSWINHLSNKDRYLHKIAQQTAAEVQALVRDKPQSGFAIILQLTGVNGSKQFDKLTKTKTVETILASMKLEGIQSYVQYLFTQFNEFDESAQDEVDSRRTWIIDQLVALIRNGGVPKSDKCLQSVMEFLTTYGLFVVKKKSSKSSITVLRQAPNPPVSEEVREVAKNRLLTCLGELSGQTAVIKSDDRTTKASAIASDGELWVAKVVSTIRALEEDTKHVSLAAELEEEEKELLVKASEQVLQLKKVMEDQKEPARGAELMVLSLILLQYCGEGRDVEAIESCLEAVSRMPFWPAKQSKEKKAKKSKDAAVEEAPADEEHEPIDVLTDVIIGFLEASTSYLRTIANVAFGYLSALVKESTVDLLVAQLERRSPAELAEDEDEDGEDVEMEDAGEDKSDEAEDEEDDDGDSSGSESFGEIDLGDDDEDEEIDVELRKKIEEALRVNGIKPATEDDDEDEEEDEELMDDDQMMAIDSQLAKVFQARASEKKGAKNANAQREATHFKNRVLDLVEIFMRKHPTNAQVPRFIIPLVEVVAGSGQDEMQLQDKAKGILRSRISKAKDYPSEANAEQVDETMEALHTQAKKTHGSDIMEILGTSSVYLAKILAQAGKDSTVEEIYRRSLEDFVTRKNSSFNTAFFKFFFQRQPVQAWKLRRSLLDFASKAINAYRQVQVLQLVEVLVTQLPTLEDQAGAVAEYMPALRESLVDLATKACTDDKAKLTAPQMKEVLKLALVAARQTKRFAEASLTEIWQPDSWSTLKQSLAQSSRFSSSTGLHKMCDQMVQSTGGQSKAKTKERSKEKKAEGTGKKSPVKRKRIADEEEDAAGPEPKVKAKKAKKAKVSS